jgi:hypothetical protein
VARRDEARVAWRLYRKQEVDGVYRLDEGAVLDDCFHFLQPIGVMALLEEVHGTALLPAGRLQGPARAPGGVPAGGRETARGRSPGPSSAEMVANQIVTLNVRDLESVGNAASRALATAGVFGQQVTRMADGSELETTERYRGCGQVTRKVDSADKEGRRHAIVVTV